MKLEYVFPFVSTTFWGISIVGAKVVGEFGYSPIEITFIRFALASLIFIPILTGLHSADVEIFPQNKKTLLAIVFLSLTGVAVNNSIFYFGLARTDASIASLLVSINPLMTMIFAVILLGEVFTRRKMISVILGIMGVALIIGFSGSTGKLEGNLFVMAALVIWGSSFSFSRLASNGGMSSIAITGWSEILGTIWLLPIFLAGQSQFSGTVNREVIFWFMFLGILSSVIAYIIHYQAIAILGASTVAPSTNIIPFSGAITAWIILGEEIQWTALFGALLIITGVIIVQLERERMFETTE